MTCVTERRWRLPEMLVGLIIVNNFLNRIERIFFDSRPCLVGYTATAPNAKLVVLENVGHNSMWEYPALALQTFLDFHESLETG